MKGRGRGNIIKQMLEAGPDDSGQAEETVAQTTSSLEKAKSAEETAAGSSDSAVRGRGRGQIATVLGRGQGLAKLPQMAVAASATSVLSEGIAELKIDESLLEEEQEGEKPLQLYHGTKGVEIPIAVNYIHLYTDPSKGLFEYQVIFAPEVGSRQVGFALLKQMRDVIGEAHTFDGCVLYLPFKLTNRETYGTGKDREGNGYQIKIIFKKQKKRCDSVHMYNILIDRIMKILKYERYNRKQFDPSKPLMIPHQKLEIWPGSLVFAEFLFIL